MNDNNENISPRSHISTLLLCVAGFFCAFCGLHRFYAGKIWTGFLWLLTLGIFGIGQIIDLVFIICGRFCDKEGRRIIG